MHPPLARYAQKLQATYPTPTAEQSLSEELFRHVGFMCSLCSATPLGLRFRCVGWREGEVVDADEDVAVQDLCEWCFNDRLWDRRLEFRLFAGAEQFWDSAEPDPRASMQEGSGNTTRRPWWGEMYRACRTQIMRRLPVSA